jgi:hypothetical protein
MARALQPRGVMCLTRPTSVAFVLGFAFVSLAVSARAQNTPPTQIPTNDAEAAAKAPSEPAIPSVPTNTPAGIFGGKHQLAIASDAGLYISNTTVSNGGGSTTTLLLQPAIDYFIIDNLSESDRVSDTTSRCRHFSRSGRRSACHSRA